MENEAICLDLRKAKAADARTVADVYLGSFKQALPSVRLAHTDDQVRSWIGRLVNTGKVMVAARDGRVLGMMVVDGSQLDQLYVAPGEQGKGVGSRLLELAKELAPGSLRLYTFQVNERARAFYEARGFSGISLGDGSGNEEAEPDVLMEWRAPTYGP